MFSNPDQLDYLSRRYLWLWIALAFQAGFANAGGFLACARFVSHMTGVGTQSGISLSQLDYAGAIEMLSAPFFFLLGAMVSGVLVDWRMLQGKPPRYLLIMFTIFVVFLATAFGGIHGMFGPFGEPLVLLRDFTLLSLLCFACGLQNACFGSLSRGQIRTTHMTGILTDIGVSWIKIRHPKLQDSRDGLMMRRVNFIRMSTFTSFFLGSAMSAITFARWQYHGFLLLAGFALLLFVVMAIQQRAIAKAQATRPKSDLRP